MAAGRAERQVEKEADAGTDEQRREGGGGEERGRLRQRVEN